MLVQDMHNRRMEIDWFKSRKRELSITNDAIAQHIGRHVSVVSKILSGKVGLELAHVDGFAAAFRVSREDILHRAGILGVKDNQALTRSNAAVFDMEGASLKEPRPNLPIHGAALGAPRTVEGEAIELTTLNNSEILEYAKRPPLLNKRPKAYGLYVQGSSMHPALPDGEMVAVVPDMPLSPGDIVVVYLRPENPEDDDGQTARAVLVKELVRRSGEHVILRQYQPPRRLQNGYGRNCANRSRAHTAGDDELRPTNTDCACDAHFRLTAMCIRCT